MARCARWIRLGLIEPLDLHASCAGLAAAQPRRAAPIVLWAQAKTPLLFAHERRLAWVEKNQYVYAIVAPALVVPGRAARWASWALSPAVATYRDFGLRAYLSGAEIRLQGRTVAGCTAAAIGECVVMASSFLFKFPATGSSARRGSASPDFRAWMREGLALAISEWAGHADGPAERALEAAFRTRVEAQYGWQFESSWPSALERRSIEAARASGFAPGSSPRAPETTISQVDFAG